MTKRSQKDYSPEIGWDQQSIPSFQTISERTTSRKRNNGDGKFKESGELQSTFGTIIYDIWLEGDKYKIGASSPGWTDRDWHEAYVSCSKRDTEELFESIVEDGLSLNEIFAEFNKKPRREFQRVMDRLLEKESAES